MCSSLAFVKTILRLLTTHRSHAAASPAQPALHQSRRVSVCLLNLISKSLLSARPPTWHLTGAVHLTAL